MVMAEGVSQVAFWRMLRQEAGAVFNIVFLVAMTGLVYIYPFDTHFRFTVSVAVLAVLLLYFHRLPVFATAALSGMAIFAGRCATQLIFDPAGVNAVLSANFPAVLYYLAYGACFELIGARRFVNNIPALILILSVIDIFSNLVELFARNDPLAGNEYTVFVSLVAVAIVRAVLAVIGYWALRRYQSFVLAEDRLVRYTELTVMIAQLKAELYYLTKSSQDIERVMEESYWLYKRLQNGADGEKGENSRAALAVARDIHEIKKDYYRVAAGIEAILRPSAAVEGMRLTEIFFIMEQTTRRFLEGKARDIEVSFSCEDDFATAQHYTLVSVLDNLITNAIEACGDTGRISVRQWTEGRNIVFCVEDNGCGIKPEDADLLFEVGYSTKFCPNSGKMSTGLGLAHVKNLVELLGGSVKVKSEPGKFTCFCIILPYSEIALPK